jgi:hypothetical protein
LVTGERRVEHDLAGFNAGVAEADAFENGTVGEDEPGGLSF